MVLINTKTTYLKVKIYPKWKGVYPGGGKYAYVLVDRKPPWNKRTYFGIYFRFLWIWVRFVYTK